MVPGLGSSFAVNLTVVLSDTDELKKRQRVRGFVREISDKHLKIQIGASPALTGKILLPTDENHVGSYSVSELKIGSVIPVEICKTAAGNILFSLIKQNMETEASGIL